MRNVIFILIVFFLSSCTEKPTPELLRVEDLLKTQPDSALYFLEKIDVNSYDSELDRAFYGLLYCIVLDKNEKPPKSDSLINNSINYFFNRKMQDELAHAYYYKARYLKKDQRFDDATIYYFKSLDILKKTQDYYYLGKIYSDLADICGFQRKFKETLKKYNQALFFFRKANDMKEVSFKFIDIGRTYNLLGNRKRGASYLKKASNSTEAIVIGSTYQEIGIDFFRNKQLDSALFYLKESLKYPYRGTSYSIRCYILSDVYLDLCEYDSAMFYSINAIKYPTTFFIQRECYRILTNSEYNKGNFEQARIYISKYQDYADSIRIIETQTSAVLLEDFHDKSEETDNIKASMIVNTMVLLIIILFVSFMAYYYYRKTKKKKELLSIATNQLDSKQKFLNQNIVNRLNEVKASQSSLRKNATAEERLVLDKELYEKSLHISNWDAFSCEMNHTFNNIIEVLLANYTSLNKKEITWCCLELLDIPTNDRVLLLNSTPEAIYKLKQRIARKIGLKNTKDLNLFLVQLSTPNVVN